jgi:hypothetical protein
MSESVEGSELETPDPSITLETVSHNYHELQSSDKPHPKAMAQFWRDFQMLPNKEQVHLLLVESGDPDAFLSFTERAAEAFLNEESRQSTDALHDQEQIQEWSDGFVAAVDQQLETLLPKEEQPGVVVKRGASKQMSIQYATTTTGPLLAIMEGRPIKPYVIDIREPDHQITGLFDHDSEEQMIVIQSVGENTNKRGLAVTLTTREGEYSVLVPSSKQWIETRGPGSQDDPDTVMARVRERVGRFSIPKTDSETIAQILTKHPEKIRDVIASLINPEK